MEDKSIQSLSAIDRTQRYPWWFIPQPFGVVSSALYIGVLLTFFLFFWQNLLWWTVCAMFASTLTLLMIERLEYRCYGENPPVRVAISLLVVRFLIMIVISQLERLHFSAFLFLIIPLLAGLYFGNRVNISVAGLMLLTFLCLAVYKNGAYWLQQREAWYDIILFGMGLIFVMTQANAFIKERLSRTNAENLLAQLEESHQRLKAYSEQIGELAATKERNRLARDIHDTLGHYLTVINVQLEKALAFRDKRPQEADQAVSDAKRLASNALQDVRHSVGALRTSRNIFSFTPGVRELVEHMQSERCSVELVLEGSEDDFSKPALIALYRAVQEGLTNVQKHAAATEATVKIVFAQKAATLTLCDNGRGFDTTVLQTLEKGRRNSEGGYGLRGVQERLELVGGHLQITSQPGEGTCLIAVVPKDDYTQTVAPQVELIVERR